MRKKYPRTPHIPGSYGVNPSDLVLNDLGIFNGKMVMITEKYDGEHICITNNECYLQYRELDHEIDASLIEKLEILQSKIPQNYEIHGEYMKLTHNIRYDELPTYLMFYYVVQNNVVLNVENTKKFLHDIGVNFVDPLYHDVFSIDTLDTLCRKFDNDTNTEGIVIRIDEEFFFDDISKYTAKYVRTGFKQIRVKSVNDVSFNGIKA